MARKKGELALFSFYTGCMHFWKKNYQKSYDWFSQSFDEGLKRKPDAYADIELQAIKH